MASYLRGFLGGVCSLVQFVYTAGCLVDNSANVVGFSRVVSSSEAVEHGGLAVGGGEGRSLAAQRDER